MVIKIQDVRIKAKRKPLSSSLYEKNASFKVITWHQEIVVEGHHSRALQNQC